MARPKKIVEKVADKPQMEAPEPSKVIAPSVNVIHGKTYRFANTDGEFLGVIKRARHEVQPHLYKQVIKGGCVSDVLVEAPIEDFTVSEVSPADVIAELG